MTTAYIDSARLAELCDLHTAIAALEGALAVSGPDTGRRPNYRLANGELLVMPAWDGAYVGVKLVTVAPANPARGRPRIQGGYLLFRAEDLSPAAYIDAAALTVLRTAALSALATSRLAVPDASSLGLFGTGPQAFGHLEAMLAVRPLSRVVVVGRQAQAVERLAAHARRLGLEAMAGSPAQASAADIVCTCTSSVTPVVASGEVRDHAHLNVVGSHRADEREVEGSLLARASVVVDSIDDAWSSGDLSLALNEGSIDRAAVAGDLGQLLRNELPVRQTELTVFKSVGMALADLAVAAAVATVAMSETGQPSRPGQAPVVAASGGYQRAGLPGQRPRRV